MRKWKHLPLRSLATLAVYNIMTFTPTGRVKTGFWKEKIFEPKFEVIRDKRTGNQVEEKSWHHHGMGICRAM